MSLLVSPQSRDAGVWQRLHGIEKGLHLPE